MRALKYRGFILIAAFQHPRRWIIKASAKMSRLPLAAIGDSFDAALMRMAAMIDARCEREVNEMEAERVNAKHC